MYRHKQPNHLTKSSKTDEDTDSAESPSSAIVDSMGKTFRKEKISFSNEI